MYTWWTMGITRDSPPTLHRMGLHVFQVTPPNFRPPSPRDSVTRECNYNMLSYVPCVYYNNTLVPTVRAPIANKIYRIIRESRRMRVCRLGSLKSATKQKRYNRVYII